MDRKPINNRPHYTIEPAVSGGRSVSNSPGRPYLDRTNTNTEIRSDQLPQGFYHQPQPSPASTFSSSSSSSSSVPASPFGTLFSPLPPWPTDLIEPWGSATATAPPLHLTIMENINQQMRDMDRNMRRMQKQMQDQFASLQLDKPITTFPSPPLVQPLPPLNFDSPFPPLPKIGDPLLPRFSEPSVASSVTEEDEDEMDNASSIRSDAGGSTGSGSTGYGPQVFSPNKGTVVFPSSPNVSIGQNLPNQPVGYNTWHAGMPHALQDKDGKKQLKLQFDMQDFKPEEIRVKKERNKLEVHAHHEEKQPDRVACRVFHQQYTLPKDVRMAKMECKMSPEGRLTVEGPVKPRHRVKFAVEEPPDNPNQKRREDYQ